MASNERSPSEASTVGHRRLDIQSLLNPGENPKLDCCQPRTPSLSPAPSATTTDSAASRRQRRESRHTYQKEEEYFLWYHRIDLDLDWRQVRKAYHNQFPHRERHGFQGIQCKYYRCCQAYGVPKVRDRDRTASANGMYCIRSRLPDVWYPWMRDSRKRKSSCPWGFFLVLHTLTWSSGALKQMTDLLALVILGLEGTRRFVFRLAFPLHGSGVGGCLHGKGADG